MSHELTRFAIVGCGGIANGLADAVEAVDSAVLGACADIDAERAQEFASKYDADSWYDDHRTMLSEVDLDVTVVATPNGAHADIVVDSARAGVDVLCQKPLEITVESLDRMIGACADHDVALGALINSRFFQGSQATKQAVERGVLGDVVLANAVCPVYRSDEYYTGWHGTADLDGGCLISQSIHMIDRLAWCLDGIEWVSADLDTVAHDIEVEDAATVQVRYGNGARGTLTASTAVREYPHYERIDVHGTEGYLNATEDEILSADSTLGDIDFEYPYDRTGFELQVADMVDAVREGRPPMVTGEEARHACEAVLAMHESDRRDERIYVEEFLDRVRERGDE